MSPEQLRIRIEAVCKKNTEIVDIKFYKDNKGKKPIQRIVIVYINRYSAISDDIRVWDGDSVEQAILRFIDPSQLKALEEDNSNYVTSIAEVESL